MKKLLLTYLSLLSFVLALSQNVGIGTTTPNSNAMLDIQSSSKGVLIPRMDSVARKAIPNVQGMLVYDTTTHSFWFNNGTVWLKSLATANNGQLVPGGQNSGDMLYWNGSEWKPVSVGMPGQLLQLNAANIPTWFGTAFPTLSTNSINSISQNSATAGGNISMDGGAPVMLRGVVWSPTPNPTTLLSAKTMDSSGTGNFMSAITGLTANTSYYVRAYATNSTGTGYGNEISFTTTAALLLPTLTTKSIDTIRTTAAFGGGFISDNGGAVVYERGVCWNTNPNPTIVLLTKTSDGTGNGAFTSYITGLSANTTYYVRSYATNSVGTAYGNEISITTPPAAIPSIYTLAVNGVHLTGITPDPINYTSGGAFNNDGGATINQKGVCWDTNQNPTVSLSTKTSDGSGTASFSSSIIGLAPNTTYYIRSYATNTAGTGYGNQLTFTTSAAPIGQNYQGGIIGYIFQPGDAGYIAGETHGLIVTATDQSGPVLWYSGSYLYTAATGMAIGTGKSNTDKIVAKYGTGNYAANICSDLVLNGYSDWYLPSWYELNMLYINRFAIGNFQDLNTSFARYYWNSTDNGYPVSQNFNTGTVYNNGPNWNANVRAIRSF